MQIPPYTTRSGVKIGILYERPLAASGGEDMERLQRALLYKPRRISMRVASRMLTYAALLTTVLFLVGMK